MKVKKWWLVLIVPFLITAGFFLYCWQSYAAAEPNPSVSFDMSLSQFSKENGYLYFDIGEIKARDRDSYPDTQNINLRQRMENKLENQPGIAFFSTYYIVEGVVARDYWQAIKAKNGKLIVAYISDLKKYYRAPFLSYGNYKIADVGATTISYGKDDRTTLFWSILGFIGIYLMLTFLCAFAYVAVTDLLQWVGRKICITAKG